MKRWESIDIKKNRESTTLTYYFLCLQPVTFSSWNKMDLKSLSMRNVWLLIIPIRQILKISVFGKNDIHWDSYQNFGLYATKNVLISWKNHWVLLFENKKKVEYEFFSSAGKSYLILLFDRPLTIWNILVLGNDNRLKTSFKIQSYGSRIIVIIVTQCF